MREILFRGKNAKGEWEYGVPFISESGEIAYMTQMHSYNVRIEPETIGQYVGLTDKNGNKIFEGDIVKTKHGRLCIVTAMATQCYVGFDLSALEADNPAPSEWDLWASCNLEIIGNIHDNPELLKESEDAEEGK